MVQRGLDGGWLRGAVMWDWTWDREHTFQYRALASFFSLRDVPIYPISQNASFRERQSKHTSPSDSTASVHPNPKYSFAS